MQLIQLGSKQIILTSSILVLSPTPRTLELVRQRFKPQWRITLLSKGKFLVSQRLFWGQLSPQSQTNSTRRIPLPFLSLSILLKFFRATTTSVQPKLTLLFSKEPLYPNTSIQHATVWLISSTSTGLPWTWPLKVCWFKLRISWM